MAKLETPQNVSLDGTVLSWDSVDGASAYEVYADDALVATVGSGNAALPVIFKQSTTALSSAMSNLTAYPIAPGTLYFTKDNYLVRDYINSDNAYARDILHGKTHSHTYSAQIVTAASVAVPSAFTVSYTSTSASLANGKTSGVAVAQHSFYPSGTVTIETVAPDSGETANYTPTGTVSRPTFTGTAASLAHSSHNHAATLSTSSSGVTSLAHAAHSHTVTGSVSSSFSGTAANITAKGTVSQPTFTGTAVSYTPAGSVAVTQNAYRASVSGEVLTLSKASITGSFTGTAANITAKGTVSQPTFTGTAVSYTPAGSVSSTFSSGSAASVTVGAHSVSIPDTVTVAGTTVGAHSYTPAGTVSQPTFTGTGTRIAAGFTGTQTTLGHTVTQGSVSGTVSYDKATSVTVKTNTNKAVTLTSSNQTVATSENS